MDKFVSLTADSVNKQEPGTLVSRFVGDVDTVENLFTSGIISMFADVCKIISILVVIWFQNRGLTLVLLVLLPFLFWFTRHVQKNMLAAQIENRKAVGRASGHVPETLHNIRTIHCLAKEAYMEERYDTYIGESYAAMERTNFYDAVYSPVILIVNAVVVAVVMLLSASGNHTVLTFFGMSAGTAVAVINYIAGMYSLAPEESVQSKTIFIDNPFGAAKDIYIWEPIFKLLATNHVQLIVPARGATPAITGRFDVNYILGQKLVDSRQQTVVVDYYSSTKESELEYTRMDYEQATFDFL